MGVGQVWGPVPGFLTGSPERRWLWGLALGRWWDRGPWGGWVSWNGRGPGCTGDPLFSGFGAGPA